MEESEAQVLAFIDDSSPEDSSVDKRIEYLVYQTALDSMEQDCLRRLIVACEVITMSHQLATNGKLADILEVLQQYTLLQSLTRCRACSRLAENRLKTTPT